MTNDRPPQGDAPKRRGRVTVPKLRKMKRRGQRIVMLTAYDATFARMFDDADIDLLLVGDSLGMVVLGFPDTTHVTLDMMVHHTAAVARGVNNAIVIGDLPIHSYDTPEQAKRLAELLQGLTCHVNVIPLNPTQGYTGEKSNPKAKTRSIVS